MNTVILLPGSSQAESGSLAATQTPDVVYFFGDSITLGWRDEDLGGWPARLLRRLHSDGYDVTGYNLGVRGDTSTGIAERWEDELRRRWREGNALLVFAFGVNDSTLGPDGRRSLPVAQTARNVGTVLERARHYPVLLIGPAPIEEALMHRRLNAAGDLPMPTPDSIADTARAIGAEARKAGVPYLDLLAVLGGDAGWRASLLQTDGLHPSSAGHDAIARQIAHWAPWQQFFPARP